MVARLCLSVALLACSIQASVIDGGNIMLQAGRIFINISSSDADFSLNGRIGALGEAECFRCPAGTLNRFELRTSSDSSLGQGMLTLGGVYYPMVFLNEPISGYPTTYFQILTADFLDTGAGEYYVPFHMLGGIQASLTTGPPGNYILNVPVTGDGVAYFHMAADELGNFIVTDPVFFTFSPEPASGFLVAGGLLVAFLIRRTSRKLSRALQDRPADQ